MFNFYNCAFINTWFNCHSANYTKYSIDRNWYSNININSRIRKYSRWIYFFDKAFDNIFIWSFAWNWFCGGIGRYWNAEARYNNSSGRIQYWCRVSTS